MEIKSGYGKGTRTMKPATRELSVIVGYYNESSGLETNIISLAQFLSGLGLSYELFVATILEAVLRPLGIQPPWMDFFKKSFVLSQERAQKVLGFVPKVTFEQGVTTTAQLNGQMGYL